MSLASEFNDKIDPKLKRKVIEHLSKIMNIIQNSVPIDRKWITIYSWTVLGSFRRQVAPRGRIAWEITIAPYLFWLENYGKGRPKNGTLNVEGSIRFVFREVFGPAA